MKYILSLDQGTTSSRAILFNENGEMLSTAQKEFKQYYPEPGWVEHDPMEIWDTQLEVARKAIEKLGISAEDIAAIGITNQRETTILWDKRNGKPVHNAIVWQCRRTAPYCDSLKEAGWSEKKQVCSLTHTFLVQKSAGFCRMFPRQRNWQTAAICSSVPSIHGSSGT